MNSKFKMGLPALALVLGISASAFTVHVANKDADTSEHFYRFNSDDPNDRLDDTKYVYIGESMPVPSGCSGSELPCIIHAEGNTTQPDFQASGISTLQDLAAVTDAEKDAN